MNNSRTPSMADLCEAYMLARARDGLRTEGVIAAARADANRAIAAHDKELREQIAREIENVMNTTIGNDGWEVGMETAADIIRGEES